MPIICAPDPFEVSETARILLAAFPRDALEVVSALIDDNMDAGDDKRAELWTAVAAAIAELYAQTAVN